MKKYSASSNAFYETAINTDIPEDAVDITDDEWSVMLDGQAAGQIIAAGSDGKPMLTERMLTAAEITAQAEAKKSGLRAIADSAIAPLQDAADLDIAIEAETAALAAWKQYRVLLNRVDTSTAPDISWPVQPEQSAS